MYRGWSAAKRDPCCSGNQKSMVLNCLEGLLNRFWAFLRNTEQPTLNNTTLKNDYLNYLILEIFHWNVVLYVVFDEKEGACRWLASCRACSQLGVSHMGTVSWHFGVSWMAHKAQSRLVGKSTEFHGFSKLFRILSDPGMEGGVLDPAQTYQTFWQFWISIWLLKLLRYILSPLSFLCQAHRWTCCSTNLSWEHRKMLRLRGQLGCSAQVLWLELWLRVAAPHGDDQAKYLG